MIIQIVIFQVKPFWLIRGIRQSAPPPSHILSTDTVLSFFFYLNKLKNKKPAIPLLGKCNNNIKLTYSTIWILRDNQKTAPHPPSTPVRENLGVFVYLFKYFIFMLVKMSARGKSIPPNSSLFQNILSKRSWPIIYMRSGDINLFTNMWKLYT